MSYTDRNTKLPNGFDFYNGVVYARHQTLALGVRDPSPAMTAWIEADARWHEDYNELSMTGGATIDECAGYADVRAAMVLS